MKVLETERLILRQFEVNDLDDFYEYANNPNVGPNAGWPPHENKETTLKILEAFMDTTDKEVRAIVYKEYGKVIGSIGIHHDSLRKSVNSKSLGYVLSHDYWGKGIMTEAVQEIIKYMFEDMKLDIISCCHYPFNTRSKRVIEKAGFKYEGVIRQAKKIYDGSVHDLVCYSITKEEYFKEVVKSLKVNVK